MQGHDRATVDEEPGAATFEVVPVAVGARLPIRNVWLSIAAAVIAIVALVGVGQLPGATDVGQVPGTAGLGGPTEPPPSSSPAATPSPAPGTWSKIGPGSYVLSSVQARVHLTMPAGWSGGDPGIGLFPGRWIGMLDLAVIPYDVSFVVTDVCADEADIDLAPVGPTVEDLARALANQAGIQRSGPTDVMLGGYPAKKLSLSLLPACPMRNGIWADASRTYGFGLRHGETAMVYVVDVNRDRLIIWRSYMNGASAEHIAQLEAITASIEIEPVPNAEPMPDLSDGGGLAIGRHELTVDGIPLSFSVPELLPDRGWSRYRGIYISKDTVGSQGAEGAIYWTAFPDGAETDPCVGMGSLEADASIADLAAAVAQAPGTELVSGPSNVTVGGRAAKRVELIVRDDLGCDPGYLFTWDPALGGPAWWTTDVGDTIRVWIVDVDGTRLAVVGETTTDAGTRTKQEIQDIVDSIAFE